MLRADLVLIFSTERGEICLLDDTDQSQLLQKVAQVDFTVLSVCVSKTRDYVIVAGSEGSFKIFVMRDFDNPDPVASSTEIWSRRGVHSSVDGIPLLDILAVGCLSQERIITLDSSHNICVRSIENLGYADPKKALKHIAAHNSMILGASALQQPNKRGSAFLTWSSHAALFFTSEGICKYEIPVPLDRKETTDDGEPNELRIVRASSACAFFITGDKHGNIGVLEDAWATVKAHEGEVSDIAITEQEHQAALVASCGRDRILQLFQLKDGKLDLQQTMENEHSASVNILLFLDNGSKLVSVSADRTIVGSWFAAVIPEYFLCFHYGCSGAACPQQDVSSG